MFKNLISNLPFSPSLAGQLGFYVKRLRKEEATRRAGLILTALALVMQGFIAFAPTDAQASASNDDIVYGGFTSKSDLLRIYDKGTDSAGRSDIQQIYGHFGVTREDIENSYAGHVNSKDSGGKIYTTGRYSYNKKGSDEQAKSIPGTNTTVYTSKVRAYDSGHQVTTGNDYPALIGKRKADGKWFAIVMSCGDVDYTELPPAPPTPPAPPKPATPIKTTPASCPINPAILKTSADCKTCEGNVALWYKDTKCIPQFTTTKTVANLTTMNKNANGTKAASGDRLEYTLSVTNKGIATGSYAIKDTISDVLEYTTLVDANGGNLQSLSGDASVNTNADTIAWEPVPLAPGQTATKRFVVQVKSTLPTTSVNPSNPESYNCQITNSFGQTTNVSIDCPGPKVIESVSKELPSTGPTENLFVAGITLAIVAYFYARSRQLGREVRLIRRDANTGTI